METINFCIHVLGLQRLNKGDAFLREYFTILNEPFWAKTGQTSDCQGGDTPRKLIQKHQNDFCRQVHSRTLFLDVCSSNLLWKPCGFIFFTFSHNRSLRLLEISVHFLCWRQFETWNSYHGFAEHLGPSYRHP